MRRAACSFSSLDAAATTRAPSASGDVDGGQPDTTPRPENEHPFAFAHGGAACQREPRRAVALDERGGLAEA